MEENIAKEYETLQQQLRSILIQKEALQIQIAEIENALEEIKNVKDEEIYKVVGSIMVKKKKEEVQKELEENKEDFELRVKSLENVEKNLIERIKKIEEKIKGGWMEYKPVLEILERIINDRTVPRNIREAVERAKNELNSKGEEELKISNAIVMLDEISNDPNMPLYTRTQIWNAVSLLEQIKSKMKETSKKKKS